MGGVPLGEWGWVVNEIKPADFDLMALAPANPLMQIAWVDCLHWAIGEPAIFERFAKDTGLRVAKSAIERAIDKATGADVGVVKRFVEWFNANVWGGEPDNTPEG